MIWWEDLLGKIGFIFFIHIYIFFFQNSQKDCKYFKYNLKEFFVGG